jgi:hypothetical protein
MVFHADANDLDVESVHVFTADDRIALSFITALGSINVTFHRPWRAKWPAACCGLHLMPSV